MIEREAQFSDAIDALVNLMESAPSTRHARGSRRAGYRGISAMKTTWTPEREAMARKLKARGFTASAAAKRLNETLFKDARRVLTRNAVIAIWHRLGLSEPLPAEDRARRKEQGKRTQRGGANISTLRAEITQSKKTGAPTLKYASVRSDAPPKGPHSVRYSERRERTCVMFCAGESGVEGFICGAPVVALTAWCAACARIVYTPAPGRAA